ncbi:HNH endonuclease [Kitasatospora albolonga]|uniref:HNH endonuclease n=1 Tax=Kitasatospora albolonga TaxID=68173 RepID=UPI0031F16ADF
MSDVVMRGPLRDIARLMQVQSGVDAEDAYAAALCWWSAAVAPRVNTSLWWPCLVWGAFLAPADRPPMITAALENAGLQAGRPGRFPSLTLHPDLTTEAGLRTAHASIARRTRPGSPFSMLLTGSPIKHGASRTSADEFLASTLRRAWDGRDYRRDDERSRLRGLGLLGDLPRIGVLWEMQERHWRYEAQTDPASSTRLLIFRCRETNPARTADRRVRAAAARAVEELARVYADLTDRQVEIGMTGEAAEKFGPIKATEQLFDNQPTLPEDQFFRLDDHTRRIAGALALAEDTQVITGAHIEAAWSVAARSGRDRAQLLCPDQQDLVDALLTATSAAVAAATGSPETLPGHKPSPPARTETRKTPSKALRRRNGKIRRDTAVAQDIKDWYGNQCQMCGTLLRIPGPRRAISEAAHIRPLSKGGHDYIGNVLCLCPNCHTQFDHGGLYLDDDLRAVETVTGAVRGPLTVDPRHAITLDNIRWHRQWHRQGTPSAAQHRADDDVVSSFVPEQGFA